MKNVEAWQLKSLRQLATINYGRSPAAILADDGEYPVVGTGGTERQGCDYLYEGDSVILGRKGTIDRVHFATGRFWTIDTAYYLSDFDHSLPRWLFYFLQTLDLRQMNEATGVPSLSRDALYKIEVPSPPEREQIKIAEVLSAVDRAIEQTDALMAKQQRIMTGLIHDLLKRGIDEKGNLRSEQTHKFKDSPVGRIPEEWDAKHLSEVADLQVGYAFKSSWFLEDGVRLLRGENVGTGVPDWKDTQYLPKHMADRFTEYGLTAGDLIIGMDRTFTKQGFKVSVLEEQDVPCLLVQRVGRFVPVNVSQAFMQLVIQSPNYQRSLSLQQKGMDIPHLSKTEILTPLVPVPKRSDEMDSIAKIVAMIRAVDLNGACLLRKLRSLKTGLMQDLLAGKKRVTALLASGPMREKVYGSQ